MIQNKTTLVGFVTLFVLSLLVVPQGVSAPGAPAQFESSMTPSPGGGQMSVASINSRPEAWTIASGKAEITAGGDLEVEVQGLCNTTQPYCTDFLTNAGATVTVTSVWATVVCGSTSSSTGFFPISGAGDAKIEATAPAACLGPIIFVRVGERSDGATGTAWLAVTGF